MINVTALQPSRTKTIVALRAIRWASHGSRALVTHGVLIGPLPRCLSFLAVSGRQRDRHLPCIHAAEGKRSALRPGSTSVVPRRRGSVAPLSAA